MRKENGRQKLNSDLSPLSVVEVVVVIEMPDGNMEREERHRGMCLREHNGGISEDKGKGVTLKITKAEW